jgi:heptosyltransferase-2
LSIPDGAAEAAKSRLSEVPRPRIGFLPGAARGPAKRWPSGHFAELGLRLAGDRACSVVLFGTAAEAEACDDIAAAVGTRATNLAGRSTLQEWAALLAECDVVVTNDSGGMHIAAAVGTPVVAVYGMTDPAVTGPLGSRCTVLQEGGERSRDIARDSQEAIERLASIKPERVYDAVVEYLGATSGEQDT